MHRQAVASALVGAGAMMLQGCGGGGSGGGSWSGFALVSQDFTLKQTSVDAGGSSGTVNGNFFMGFDGDRPGFGINFEGTKKTVSEGGEVDTEWGIWFMYDLTPNKAYFCQFDTEKMDKEKYCFKATVKETISKEKFNECVQKEAKKLSVTDDGDLHKVDMVPADVKEQMKKDESLANAGAFLYVDNSNMIQKMVFEIAKGLAYTVEGTSKAISDASFATPAKFQEAYAAAKEKEDIPVSFKTLPAEAAAIPLLECIGFAPGQDGKPDTPPATITV